MRNIIRFKKVLWILWAWPFACAACTWCPKLSKPMERATGSWIGRPAQLWVLQQGPLRVHHHMQGTTHMMCGQLKFWFRPGKKITNINQFLLSKLFGPTKSLLQCVCNDVKAVRDTGGCRRWVFRQRECTCKWCWTYSTHGERSLYHHCCVSHLSKNCIPTLWPLHNHYWNHLHLSKHVH